MSAQSGTRFGIQPRAAFALLRAFVTMDLRGQFYGLATGVTPSMVMSPLYWVVGQMLTASCLLSAALFGRVDAWFFAFAGLSNLVLMVFSAIVVEFHEAALNPDDTEILGHRPLTARTLPAARFGNLLFYAALLTVALTIFPAIMGTGLADSGLRWLPAYLWAAVVCGMATVGVALLLFTLAPASNNLDGARTVLSWVQIVAILVFFYGAQLMVRDASGGVELFAAKPPLWLRRLPTAVVADVVASAVNGAGVDGSRVMLVSVLALALTVAALVRLGHAWRHVTHGATSSTSSSVPTPPAGSFHQGWVARVCRARSEVAGFWIVWIMFRRDPELRSRSFPALALPLSAALCGWLTGQLEDPMTDAGTGAVLSIATNVLLVAAVPTILHNLRYSRDHEAGWLLLGSPLAPSSRLAIGARRGASLTLMTPVFLVLLTVLAIIWANPAHAMLHVAWGWLLAETVSWLSCTSLVTSAPFSQQMPRGGTIGSAAIQVAGISALAMTCGGVWYVAAQTLVGAVLFLAVLGCALVCVRHHVLTRADRGAAYG